MNMFSVSMFDFVAKLKHIRWMQIRLGLKSVEFDNLDLIAFMLYVLFFIVEVSSVTWFQIDNKNKDDEQQLFNYTAD